MMKWKISSFWQFEKYSFSKDSRHNFILISLNHSHARSLIICSSFQSEPFLSPLLLFGLIVNYSSALGDDC